MPWALRTLTDCGLEVWMTKKGRALWDKNPAVTLSSGEKGQA